MSLKIAVVGAGGVGSKLGKMAGRTHQVQFGVRDPAKYAHLAGGNISVKSVKEAVAWADVVLVAAVGGHEDATIQAVAASLGPDIKGKVVVDAMNPLTAWPALEVRWNGKSGGEVFSEALPGSHVFKAFNTIGDNQMEHGDGSAISGQQLTMMFAGGPEGKDKVEELIGAVGFKPVFVGPIRYARNLEAIAELWIHLGVPGVGTAEKWGRDFHFQVLKK